MKALALVLVGVVLGLAMGTAGSVSADPAIPPAVEAELADIREVVIELAERVMALEVATGHGPGPVPGT